MILDARGVPDGSELFADVCVVGGGPAAIAIATRLSGTGLGVVILESGGLRTTLRDQRLSRGAQDGRSTWPLESTRARTLGGSANFWGGWCRPLDPVDIEPGPGVDDPLRRWPITYDDLSSRAADVDRFLQLPRDAFPDAQREHLPRSAAAADAGLATVSYRFSPHRDTMGIVHRPTLAAADDIQVYLHATVRELRLAQGRDRVAYADVDTGGAGGFRCRADRFVLAAGAIENARLLLASDNDVPQGLGNEYDQVGRYFMEHLQAHVGYLIDGEESLRSEEFARVGQRPLDVPCAALASHPAQRDDPDLLGMSLTVTDWRVTFDHRRRMHLPGGLGFVAADRRRKPQAPAAAAGAIDEAARIPSTHQRVSDHLRNRRLQQLAAPARALGQDVRLLYMRAEQLPNAESRVTLDSRRDRLGVRRARLSWALQPVDLTSPAAWLIRLADTLRLHGAGQVYIRSDWRRTIAGGPHHMGTTRMATDPAEGVVDADSRVHTVENLYVAGSSVFSTGGYANPTYSMIGLSLRLADHLAGG